MFEINKKMVYVRTSSLRSVEVLCGRMSRHETTEVRANHPDDMWFQPFKNDGCKDVI